MRTVLLLLLLASSARADFSSDAMPQSLDILSRLISAAEHSGPAELTPHTGQGGGRPTAYYVRRASYIGQCEAAFGTVHILALHYTRSAAKDSRNLPRGHSFVLFFDQTLKLRGSWRVDFDTSALSLRDGSKLFFGDTAAFDYANLPQPSKLTGEAAPTPHVVIDGAVFEIPTWASPK